MDCPVCKKEMYDNRNSKKNPKAPDYRCKDKNCKYQFNMKIGDWEPSEYGTAVWLPKEKPEIKRTEQEEKIYHSSDKLPPINVFQGTKQPPSNQQVKKETDWDAKEKREHKRALTMQAFSLFPPITNESGINPMDRWLAVKDMRDCMLTDLYND